MLRKVFSPQDQIKILFFSYSHPEVYFFYFKLTSLVCLGFNQLSQNQLGINLPFSDMKCQINHVLNSYISYWSLSQDFLFCIIDLLMLIPVLQYFIFIALLYISNILWCKSLSFYFSEISCPLTSLLFEIILEYSVEYSEIIMLIYIEHLHCARYCGSHFTVAMWEFIDSF